MALTGLGLSLFLLMHLLGNLIILSDANKFNLYAHSLESMGPLLIAAEVGLILVFIFHIIVAVKLTLQNRRARPVAYVHRSNTGRSRRSLGSSYMIVSGTIILLFIIFHILDFKFGNPQVIQENGVQMRDLAGLVKHEFSELGDVIFYVVALVLIGIHLWHGFRSLFDTLGVATSRWECLFHKVSQIYVALVTGGFVLIPIWLYLCGGGR